MLGNKSHRHYAHLRCESHPSIHCMTWRCLPSLSFSLYPRDLLCWVLLLLLNKAAPEYRIKSQRIWLFSRLLFLVIFLLALFLMAYVTHQQHHKSLSRTWSSNSSSIITFSLLSSSIILYMLRKQPTNP